MQSDFLETFVFPGRPHHVKAASLSEILEPAKKSSDSKDFESRKR